MTEALDNGTGHYSSDTKMNKFSQQILIALAALAGVGLSVVLIYQHKPYSLSYMLKSADFAGISQYGLAQDGTLITGPGITVLKKSKNYDILSLLKTSSSFHSSSAAPAADYVIDLQSYKGERHLESYFYVVATGELGRDHDWCYVPNAFRLWMKTLPKPHHTMYRITRTLYYETVHRTK